MQIERTKRFSKLVFSGFISQVYFCFTLNSFAVTEKNQRKLKKTIKLQKLVKLKKKH